MQVGLTGGTGTITQDGVNTVAEFNGQFVGFGSHEVEGAGAGTGIYNLKAGLLDINSGTFTFGLDAGRTGNLNQTGGQIDAESQVTIGYAGTGTYAVSAGTADFGNGLSVAAASGSTGTVTQTGGTVTISGGKLAFGAGTGTYHLNAGRLNVGGANGIQSGAGTATFNLAGGTLGVTGSNLTSTAVLTLADGKTSTIDTAGLNATFSALGGTGSFTKTGQGTLTLSGTASSIGEAGAVSSVTQGTLAITGNKTVIGYLAANGLETVFNTADTAAISLTTGGSLTIGNSSSAGSYLLLGYGKSGATSLTGAFTMDGGTLTVVGVEDAPFPGSGIAIGDLGGTGRFTMSGGTVDLADGGNVTNLAVGTGGGTGEFIQSGGTVHLGTNLSIGAGEDSTGSYALSGNAILNALPSTVSTIVYVGDDGGTGTMTIDGTAAVNFGAGSSLWVGGSAGAAHTGSTGTVTQTGGTLTFAGNYFYLGGQVGDTGTYNLNGGTLEVGGTDGIRKGGGMANFYFGGGTLKVIGSALTTSLNLNLTAGTVSTINTNAIGATLSGSLTAGGLHTAGFGGHTLNKTGAGTLNLTGATRTLDTFNLNAGSAGQSAGNTTALAFNIANGSTFTLSGGTLAINSSTETNNTTVVDGALNIAAGTFTQSAGTVTLGGTDNPASLHIGRDGAGVYNLSGGTLSLAGGVHDLGLTTGGSAGSGEFNLSGGLVELTSATSALVIGDTDGAGAEGSGTFNQTGGTLRVTSGGLWLSSRGNGTYNLDGGTLEVGGGNLHTFYEGAGTGTGTYAFNLGGGTVKVIGSALTTDANITLKTGTVSTINTNAFGATLTGVLTGTGGLTKTGSGVLSLTADSSYSGNTTVTTGTLRVDGQLSGTVITVGTGATLTGGGGAKSVVVQGGGKFAVGGETPGTFNVAESLTLAENSETLLEIASLASHDSITVGGTLYVELGDLRVTFIGGYMAVEGDSFTLFNAGGFDGTFEHLWLPTLTAGLEWDTSALYTDGDISVIASAVPEPATWAALFGGAALAAAGLRRRRRAV